MARTRGGHSMAGLAVLKKRAVCLEQPEFVNKHSGILWRPPRFVWNPNSPAAYSICYRKDALRLLLPPRSLKRSLSGIHRLTSCPIPDEVQEWSGERVILTSAPPDFSPAQKRSAKAAIRRMTSPRNSRLIQNGASLEFSLHFSHQKSRCRDPAPARLFSLWLISLWRARDRCHLQC